MAEMHRNVQTELLPALYPLKMDFQYVGDALLLLRNVLINTNQNPLPEVLKAGFF
ncbi:hypothetical protein SAMN05421594_0571 [Chryseobacterium oleae]|uniref:Uncharacterized protein n=1 Tax=Chryseobacterium oleae TaxID=491207 RepID=A0A1I4VS32_CHROL|nr:hypothetical protein SAMN05421594_0571 [Chryseobacterium oleae]